MAANGRCPTDQRYPELEGWRSSRIPQRAAHDILTMRDSALGHIHASFAPGEYVFTLLGVAGRWSLLHDRDDSESLPATNLRGTFVGGAF